jgi:hypothetical protein
MFVQRHMQHPALRRRGRVAVAIAASTVALATLAILPAPGLATNTIKVGAGGTSIIVNGTTISTRNLTLAELAKLQGVPTSTVDLELDGAAAGTPAAGPVEALVASLPAETALASALNQISAASGGAINPEAALRQIVADEGQPGASGANGAGGASPGGGANGGAGASGLPSAAGKRAFTLRVSPGSLKGRPGSRVRVKYTVSDAAKLSYSGRKLAKGSRKVGSGSGSLMVKLPRRHGDYRLAIRAVSATEGKSAQASVTLHDAQAKKVGKRHH